MTDHEDRETQITALRRILDETPALATPEQLTRVFDLYVWSAPRPGVEEDLDAGRFGEWLEVLMDAGVEVAAEKLTGMDPELIVSGLSRHVRVCDRAAKVDSRNDAPTFDVGGYVLEARRDDALGVIIDVLLHLDANHPQYFHTVMRGCRELSNEGFELDGLDNLLSTRDQQMFDVAVDREERREASGYVPPQQARAFLQLSRELRRTHPAPPRPELVVGSTTEISRPVSIDDLLGPDHMEALGYLANVMIAGCPFQDRAFTPREAMEATLATCTLGFEHSLARGDAPVDLTAAFQTGWAVLYRDVVMHAAEQLLVALAPVASGDTETNSLLGDLQSVLTKHWRNGEPWKAREALDVIMILDTPAWAGLVKLIAEFPVRPLGPNDFEFIATRAQIDTIYAFLSTLPSALSPLP